MTHLKFGAVCDRNAPLGLFRVNFDEDEITSDWLSAVVTNTQGSKVSHPFDINEQVACLMDEHCEQGVILGAVWSNEDQPDGAGDDVWRVFFSDGAFLQYDRAAHVLHVKNNTTELKVKEAGFEVKRGGESLKAILVDLLTQILALTVTTSTGPSGTPINAAALQAIKDRIPNLLP